MDAVAANAEHGTSEHGTGDERWFEAVYRIRASASQIDSRADALALEQSVELPRVAVTARRVREEVVARVANITEWGDDASCGASHGQTSGASHGQTSGTSHGATSGTSHGATSGTSHGTGTPRIGEATVCEFAVTLRLAVETTGHEAGQLLNMLFGNSSLQNDVALVDVRLPAGFARHFGGPAYGIAGIRALTGVFRGPLTCTALKPVGTDAHELARLAAAFARAGIDVVKDDHGLADQASAPFAERVPRIQRAIDGVNRVEGRRCVYAPSLTGDLDTMRSRAALARDCGVRMFLLAPMVSGVASLAALARELGAPILAHPALAGCAAIARPLLLGRLFRLFGADATIFPHAGGRFGLPLAECGAIAAAARENWHGLAATLPVPAGGIDVERAHEVSAVYGDDAMLLIGGSLLMIPDGLDDRCRAFVAAVKGTAMQETPVQRTAMQDTPVQGTRG